MAKNKLVLLIGSPGSGKGTQALLLAEKKKMIHLEASKLLEKRFLKSSDEEVVKIGEKEFSLKEQEKKWRNGFLCDDEFVNHVVKENLEKMQDKSDSVLLDGYPRTVNQAKLAFSTLFDFYKKGDVLVIYLSVEAEESIKRNSNRRVCSLMRHSIVDLPETKSLSVCPLDGSPLEKRVMDDPEKIKVRLREFKERTAPVVDFFKSKKIKVSRVDGMGTVSDVFFRILKETEELDL